MPSPYNVYLVEVCFKSDFIIVKGIQKLDNLLEVQLTQILYNSFPFEYSMTALCLAPAIIFFFATTNNYTIRGLLLLRAFRNAFSQVFTQNYCILNYN